MDMGEAQVNPIMDKFVNVLGPEGILSLANFTVSVIKSLWSIVDDALNAAWLEGRGRKSTTSPKDCLFMTLTSIELVLSNKFIVCPSMATLNETGCRFTNHAYASYAVEKHYFSGKHHLYDNKIETAVSPHGRCVSMSYVHPGSVHDLTIMHTRRDVHKANLTKTPREGALPDNGELSTDFPTYCACLVDMGYSGGCT
ncbi:hypothetical protein H257_08767 [Aphanomyces astaci]|uniref:DDE Tnp4 domain-containing protein n=1 Tax=Aphanomyces astaci TaxID=112090 RepID=W4GDG6_APHAT|nr:hypothetical protein H257_08767 [Aphanomyces astaci]ETV77321.1 hypothetical protein H257_08767 [Aphanomyces astaci]|eukprot:XP_009833108.1 hypothetical protein H257_08767 [Aphanomyces astaci]